VAALPLAVTWTAYTGELAAMATAACWTCSALAFTAAGRRIGSVPLNLLRLVIALALSVTAGWFVRGLALPTDASAANWFWLALSGVAGFFVGDLCLFRAYLVIGPRVTLLILSLVPPTSALLGLAVLGERMSMLAVAGMVLTLAGIVWVILEGRPPERRLAQTLTAPGILLALGSVAGQSAGMADYHPFAAAQIRMMAAMAMFIVLFFAIRAWPRVYRAVRHPGGMAYTAMGALVGPFLGVWFMLVAIKSTYLGIATTIIATMPILILPFAVVLHRERVSPRAIAGAVLAVIGVAMLFL
jgi:drug/metabolite transporter (DMT)-like permease